jgi:hypothetical protein
MRNHSVVRLANHTILIAKDGTQIPIDDGGAPLSSRIGALIGADSGFPRHHGTSTKGNGAGCYAPTNAGPR